MINFEVQPANLGEAFLRGRKQYHDLQATREYTNQAPIRKRLAELGVQREEQAVKAGEQSLRAGELDFQNEQTKRYLNDAYRISAIEDPKLRVAEATKLAESYFATPDPMDDEAGNNILQSIQNGTFEQLLGSAVEAGIAGGVLKAPQEKQAPTPSSDIQAYQAALQTGFKGSFVDFQREMANLKEPTASPAADIQVFDKAVADGYSGSFMDFLREKANMKLPTGTTMVFDPESGSMTVQTNVPVGDMSKPTQTAIEKKILALNDAEDKLNSIEASFNPDILTYKGQVKNWFSVTSEKLGREMSEEEKASVQAATQFRTEINRFFNDYRKEITGAAASVKELDRLKASMFNENNSPTEFKAAFSSFRAGVKRTKSLYAEMLKSGLTPEQAQKKLDEESLSEIREFSSEAADAQKWIDENPDSPKVQAIKEYYGI